MDTAQKSEVAGAFLRQDPYDRMESILLTRYYKTCFDNWEMKTLEAQAVDKGLVGKNQISEVMDEYRKFLSIIASIDPTGVPTGKVKSVWELHKGTEDYASMCKTYSCSALLVPVLRQTSVEGLYKIVFSELPDAWK